MSDQLLACVQLQPVAVDLVDINSKFRWSSVRVYSHVVVPIKGRYVEREVLAVGDSHGVYNGCLGPPPRMLARRGKLDSNRSKRSHDELYIGGTRLERGEVRAFLAYLCCHSDCLFRICDASDIVEKSLREGVSSSCRLSLDDAVREWPSLLSEDRKQVIVMADGENQN